MGGIKHQTTAASQFSLHLLGNLQLLSNGQYLELKTKKEKWLLALLALRRGKEVEREWLAGVLWPDSEESQALYNLRRELSNLKADLGTQHTRLQAGYSHAIRLDLSEAEVDVLAFDAAIARKDPVSLQEAVAWYRGPLLQDCLEEWVYDERIQREQAYLTALDTLASTSLTQEQWNEAARYARLAIAADPLQETTHRTLMQALAQSGSHAAAAQVYRDLRLRLREEINAEPDLTTQELFAQIRQRARQQLASPARITVSNPPATPPSPVSSALPPIPLPLTALIGQEEALTEILALLPSTRLFTLTGAGGVGKTRLALEIVHAVAKDYAEGVAFVDLASLTDPDLLPHAVATALNLREEASIPLTTTLTTSLRTKHMLLVIDNCEHLLEAAAMLIHSLLQSCSEVHVLATSRQSLRLPGETVWRVPSLLVPPERKESGVARRAKQDVSEWLEYPAVRLFVERVRQANPEFRLTPSNLEAIACICRRLDGIPLALELAAGRVRALSLEQISERLQDRFKLLSGGNRAALPRQQTLRALVDWSYALLEAEEKRLLASLSVFLGGWTLEAAEAVCAGEGLEAWDVLDFLTSLMDKSLVLMEEQDGEVRYRMLETIRQYAQEQLPQHGAERSVVMRRLRDYYSDFVRDLRRQQFLKEGARWMDRAEREVDNLRSVMDFCAEDAPSLSQGLVIAACLRNVWQVIGFISEGRRRLESLLAADRKLAPTPERCEALGCAGILARDQGDYIAARRYAEEGLEIALALDDQDNISVILGHLGTIHHSLGEYDRAIDYYQRAIVILENMGNLQNIAANLNNLAVVLLQQKNYSEAHRQIERALAINRQRGNRQWELYNLLNLGTCAWELQDETEAGAYLQQALTLSQELKDRHVMAKVLWILGSMALKQEKVTEANALFLQSLPIFQEFEDQEAIGHLLFQLSEVAFLQERWETGVCLFTSAESVFARIGGIHQEGIQNYVNMLHERFSQHFGTEAFAMMQAQARRLTPDERIARILADA